jgi:hypothetical protein
MFARYDEGADRFSMLTVYEHFRSSGPVGNKENLATDGKELVRLWSARERMIPIEPSFFGTPNCLELPEDHRSLVDAEKDVEAAGIKWKTIEIIPGRNVQGCRRGAGALSGGAGAGEGGGCVARTGSVEAGEE